MTNNDVHLISTAAQVGILICSQIP